LDVRIVGVMLFVFGAVAVAWSLREADRRSRPGDVAFALLALVAVLLAMLGLVLTFVPGFL